MSTGRPIRRRGQILDLAHLTALHAVARTGSISAAAGVLHITTSAVSQRLAKMERDVGQPLLSKRGRGVRLTDAAELLVGYADQIFNIVDEAEAAIESRHGTVTGKIYVAAFSTAARGLLPAAVVPLQDRHPELRVELSEMEPDVCLDALMREEIDLAVVQDWFNHPLELSADLVRAPLLDDLVDIALPAAHRLAGRETVDFDELLHDPWVTWPVGTVCHNWLLRTCRERGVELNVQHTAGEYATQLALVAAGLGVAAVPRLGRDWVPPGVEIVEVRPELPRHVYAVWRPESARSERIHAVLDALAKAVADLGRLAGSTAL
jgi:DNA-binding transcriptional LysR family regulator